MGQRMFCGQDHPGSDVEADAWCEAHHWVRVPRRVPDSVEVVVQHALPGFAVVGMSGEDEVEVRDRARVEVLSAGGVWPTGRVTVSALDGEGRVIRDQRMSVPVVVRMVVAKLMGRMA